MSPDPKQAAALTECCHVRNECEWRSDIWRIDTYREIEDILGKERATDLLKIYVSKLKEAASYLQRRQISESKTRQLAHDLKSMSGQLGFEALYLCSAGLMAKPDREAVVAAAKTSRALIDATRDAVQFYTTAPRGETC